MKGRLFKLSLPAVLSKRFVDNEEVVSGLRPDGFGLPLVSVKYSRMAVARQPAGLVGKGDPAGTQAGAPS